MDRHLERENQSKHKETAYNLYNTSIQRYPSQSAPRRNSIHDRQHPLAPSTPIIATLSHDHDSCPDDDDIDRAFMSITLPPENDIEYIDNSSPHHSMAIDHAVLDTPAHEPQRTTNLAPSPMPHAVNTANITPRQHTPTHHSATALFSNGTYANTTPTPHSWWHIPNPPRATAHNRTSGDPPSLDTLAWGDLMQRDSQYCRICFQNVGGITDKIDAILGQRIKALKINILGLAETNVNWDFRDSKHEFVSRIRPFFQATTFDFSNSCVQFQTAYQPGGTATITSGRWSSQSTHHHHQTTTPAARSTRTKIPADPDGKGRWSALTINGRGGRKVTLITAYRVCDQSFASAGVYTAFRQQYLLEDNISPEGQPNQPRVKFLQDMAKFISTLRSAGHDIILMIDANESTTQRNSKLRGWLSDMDLIDPITIRHGPNDQPASVPTGSTRIDYILLSRPLYPYLHAAGILPFHHIFHSDHRPLFIDIDLDAFLLGAPNARLSSSTRGICSNNPKAVTKYQEKMIKFLARSNIEHEFAELVQSQKTNGFLSPGEIMRIQAIDSIISSQKLKIEEVCRFIKSDPWSPKFLFVLSTVRYWDSWRRQPKSRIDGTAYRQRMRPDLEQLAPYSTEVIKKSLRLAQHELAQAKLDADTLRSAHLTDLAAMLANTGRAAEAARVKQIETGESIRQTFRSCHIALQKPPHKPVTHVLIPNQHGSPEPVVDQLPMEAAFIARNIKHFDQASGTPFTVPPLSTTFGPYGTNKRSAELLQGQHFIPPSAVSEATNAILQSLTEISAPEIDVTIYPDDIIRGYTVWRESTSTSPYGDHLGHNKAILRHISPPTAETVNTPDLAWRLATISSGMFNLATANNFSLLRWLLQTNAMIEKDPGIPLIDRFRIINIIPSDWNWFVGEVFHRLISQGEFLQQFGNEQSGSRKGRGCPEPQLLKHCIYSIMRTTRATGSTFDNDAKSCYDRIVLLLPSLLAQRLGMPAKFCELYLSTQAKMTYNTKTAYGVSADTYTSTPQNTIHGPGQGSKAAPAIWTLISCFLLAQLPKKSKGVSLTDPTGTITTRQFSAAFVDDITLWNIDIASSLRNPESLETLYANTTEMAQWWENILHTSGGKLELRKCFYYIFAWTFSAAGIPSYSPSETSHHQVRIRDSQSHDITAIEQKSCSTSHKTLGKMETPSGDYRDEAKRIKEKADAYGQNIFLSALNYTQATSLYFGMYLPGVSYGLSSGCMTVKQAADAQSSTTCAILTRMGYSRNTPRQVVFAPRSHGGIGLRHLFAEQGTQQVLEICSQIRRNTTLGDNILITLLWAQRMCGTSTPILENPSGQLPQLGKEPWILSIRDFLSKSNLSLRLTAITASPPKRLHDRNLMDVAASSGLFSKADIRAINRCRLFLQVESITDIANAAGSAISPWAWDCSGPPFPSKTLWPIQTRPNTSRQWTKLLEALCSSAPPTLDQPLGNWLQSPHYRLWPAYYHTTSKTVATSHNGIWAQSNPITEHHTRDKWQTTGYIPLTQPPDISAAFCPVDLSRAGQNHYLSSPQPYHPCTSPTTPRSWDGLLDSLPSWEQHLLSATEFDPVTLSQALNNTGGPTIITVSDGSCRRSVGTFAWRIESDTITLAKGSGKCGGSPITPLRAECSGILSWTCFLSRFCQLFGIAPTCRMEPYCDSKAALQYITQAAQPATKDPSKHDPLRDDFDITATVFLAFRQLRALYPQLQDGAYVKAHQLPPFIDRQSFLNHLCDKEAKAVRISASYTRSDSLPACAAYLLHDGTTITSKDRVKLRWNWRIAVYKKWLGTKLTASATSIQSINWEATATSQKSLSATLQRFSTKLSIRWLPTAARLSLFGNELDECPWCQASETNPHIFRCPQRQTVFKHNRDEFSEFLLSIQTPDQIIIPLSHRIFLWQTSATKGAIARLARSATAPVRRCMTRQDSLGWRAALCGILDVSWSKLIPDHNQSNTGTTWQAKVSTWLIETAHDVWIQRNDERFHTEERDNQNAAAREATAQVARVYALASAYLSIHDQRELIRETIDERLQFPVAINTIWAKQLTPLIYRRIEQNRRRPQIHDIRQFFPVLTQNHPVPTQAILQTTATTPLPSLPDRDDHQPDI